MSPTPQTNNPWNAAAELVIQLLVKVSSIDSETVRKYIEIPPDPNLGDIASTVSFQLAKELKKSPVAIRAIGDTYAVCSSTAHGGTLVGTRD